MNSTPKQQDGDDGGVAPASGARPSLEQTVLGVAPAGAAPPVAAPAAPDASPPQQALPTAPLLLEVTAPHPPVVSFAGASAGSAASALVAAPVIVVAASESAGPEPRGVERELPAPPPSVGPVTMPIPLVYVTLPVEVATPPRPTSARATAAASRSVAADTTLPIGATPTAAEGTAPSSRGAEPSAQRTALSDDFLREARQAALQGLERGSAPPASSVAPPEETSRSNADAPPPSFGTRPSIVSTPLPHEGDPHTTSDLVSVKSSRFEPVPVVRAPLAESLSGGLGPVAEVGGHRNGVAPTSARPRGLPARRSGDMALRWLLLAAVALVSVASVMVGQRLWQRYRDAGSPPSASAALASSEAPSGNNGAASTARALMPSRAPVGAAPPGRALVVSVTGARPGEAPSAASANPESQVAATAGRHVIAGNYADALPLYQQLERAYPENTAYVAMSRLLEKKVGASNDTLTVTPAPSKPVKK